MTIKVEMDAGSTIENSFKEATDLAVQLRCTVEFNFNGVTCWAFKHGKAENGAKAYFQAIHNGQERKYASNN